MWQRWFGWLVNSQGTEGSFSNLVHVVQKVPKLFPLFAVTAWSIWHRQNKSRLQEATVPLGRLAEFAENYLHNFADREGHQVNPVRRTATATQWSPPSDELVKINFDGALFGESESVGIGVVIRNLGGEVMASLSEKIVKPQAAELVEILAAQRAVLFSRETGFFKSVFEGDSTTVIKLLQDRNVSYFQDRHILKEIGRAHV